MPAPFDKLRTNGFVDFEESGLGVFAQGDALVGHQCLKLAGVEHLHVDAQVPGRRGAGVGEGQCCVAVTGAGEQIAYSTVASQFVL